MVDHDDLYKQAAQIRAAVARWDRAHLLNIAKMLDKYGDEIQNQKGWSVEDEAFNHLRQERAHPRTLDINSRYPENLSHLVPPEELELRKLALEITLKYDTAYGDILPKAHAIYVWLMRGTEEAANCKWVQNDG